MNGLNYNRLRYLNAWYLISTQGLFPLQNYEYYPNLVITACEPNNAKPWTGTEKSTFFSHAMAARKKRLCIILFMMTSSNGNIFRVIGHLWGESTGHRWIPFTKASDVELWCFLWCSPEHMTEHSRFRWFETLSCSFWRHCNDISRIPSSLHVYLTVQSTEMITVSHRLWRPGKKKTTNLIMEMTYLSVGTRQI